MQEPSMPASKIVVVTVPATSYPAEVHCRDCHNLMLPADLVGAIWACHLCRRQVVVHLAPPALRRSLVVVNTFVSCCGKCGASIEINADGADVPDALPQLSARAWVLNHDCPGRPPRSQ